MLSYVRSFSIILLTTIIAGNTLANELPSWNEGKNKDQIIDFIESTIDKDSKNFVPVNDRIAVFDNDGTLWTEYPIYNEIYFLSYQLLHLKEQGVNANMLNKEPFSSLLHDREETLKNLGLPVAFKALSELYANQRKSEINRLAKSFIQTKHPERNLLFANLAYQPMLELLDYLKENDYRVYIVSGGSSPFMRAIVPSIYGIRPENIIGSKVSINATMYNGKVDLIYDNHFENINNGIQKVVNIEQVIGKMPVLAVGNSDGDIEMLTYTTSNKGRQLALIIDHDDAEREGFGIGGDNILELSGKNDEWHIISVKNDFKTLFSE